MPQVAAIYNRVSGKKQDEDGHSLDEQYRRCREYCIKKGYVVRWLYREVGSGSDPNRPRMNQLIRDAADGRFNVVVITHRDRWGRHVAFNAMFEGLLNSFGVVLDMVDRGVSDPSPETEYFNNMMDAGARYFVRRNTANFRAGKHGAARKGILPRKAPFGYARAPTKKLVIVPEEAAIVRELLRLVAGGASLREISARTGLSRERIRFMVFSPAYEGRLVYDGIVTENAWEPMAPLEVILEARRRVAETWATKGWSIRRSRDRRRRR